MDKLKNVQWMPMAQIKQNKLNKSIALRIYSSARIFYSPYGLKLLELKIVKKCGMAQKRGPQQAAQRDNGGKRCHMRH